MSEQTEIEQRVEEAFRRLEASKVEQAEQKIKSATSDFTNSLLDTFSLIVDNLSLFVPKLLVVLSLAFIGWLTATLARKLVKFIVNFFVFFSKNKKNTSSSLLQSSIADILSKLFYFIVIVFFILFINKWLEWEFLEKWVDNLLKYLPNILTGLLIIFTGIFFADFLKKTIVKGIPSAQGILIVRISQFFIIFVCGIIGIEQAGINIQFLTLLLVVVIGVILFGLVISFSLGAQNLVSNLVSGQQLKKHLLIGMKISYGEINGHILDISSTYIVIDSENGKRFLPNSKLQKNGFVIHNS